MAAVNPGKPHVSANEVRRYVETLEPETRAVWDKSFAVAYGSASPKDSVLATALLSTFWEFAAEHFDKSY